MIITLNLIQPQNPAIIRKFPLLAIFIEFFNFLIKNRHFFTQYNENIEKTRHFFTFFSPFSVFPLMPPRRAYTKVYPYKSNPNNIKQNTLSRHAYNQPIPAINLGFYKTHTQKKNSFLSKSFKPKFIQTRLKPNKINHPQNFTFFIKWILKNSPSSSPWDRYNKFRILEKTLKIYWTLKTE